MASKSEWCSGRCFSMALMISLTFQMKIPEFQKNSPDCTNICANSKLGFSVKHFTREMVALSLFWIYPYPVSGREGVMPMVISALLWSANSMASPVIVWNSASLSTRWSAGVTIIIASGESLRR